MAKTMRTFKVTNPEDPSCYYLENSSREIKNASIGIFEDGDWFVTLTTQVDLIKASKAAKGSNKYIARSILGTIEEVPFDNTVTYFKKVEA